MNITQSEQKFSEDELNAERKKLILEHFADEGKTQFERENLARAQSALMKNHKTIPGLGKCVAVIPQREFHRLVAKYGYETVHSREFMKYFNKAMPDLSPNKA